jgi:hypothetical protein
MLDGSKIATTSNVEISIGKVDVSKLSSDEKLVIGNRPVIDLNLKVDGVISSWSNPDAPVTITIPYTPSAEELANPERITVLYIDSNGKMTAIPTAKYDTATGTVSFKTTHFNKYAVAYVSKTFKDIGNYSWAKNAIEVMASRGVINGTSSDTFAPGDKIKRADLMVLLVKALGLSANANDNFSDVDSNSYYAEALAVAKELGIATGVGNNKFNPDEKISRQDAMTLIYRAMKVANKQLTQGTDKEIATFTDKDSVADYALESVKTLIKNGIVTGSEGKVNPLGNATRAEIAVMIYRIYNK